MMTLVLVGLMQCTLLTPSTPAACEAMRKVALAEQFEVGYCGTRKSILENIYE